MNDERQLLEYTKESKTVFLLTNPPHSDRARFCLQLIMRSDNALLYLAGDGVYNLLSDALNALPIEKIFACEEDLKARGVQSEGMAVVPEDFYAKLAEDIMFNGNKIYAF